MLYYAILCYTILCYTILYAILCYAIEGVCPAGKAIADIPIRANQSHAIAECSNRGS